MRVCQPSPEARKLCTTAWDKRMVMRSFTGAFCGPRTPTLRRKLAGSDWAPLKRGKSLAIISLTSPWGLVSGLDFGITFYLSGVGLPEANNPNSFGSLGEAEHMQAGIQHADGDIACFA